METLTCGHPATERNIYRRTDGKGRNCRSCRRDAERRRRVRLGFRPQTVDRADPSRWTRENLAWMAGLFEGEGCIGTTQNYCRLYLNMTDEDVVRRLHLLAGMGRVFGPYGGEPVNGRPRKPYWAWTVRRETQAYALLVAIYPWLGQRRRGRARECIARFAAGRVER